MRLTKLTLSGFKSFAKTTAFEFPAAASAIVGPNGSGKSNVAEAIRWVLGEQSMKSLRGKRGEDLIFNGSATSPRMGKAAAALAFDNRDRKIPLDYEEVILERKIFRDGTNEYFLQGSQVRLKDIVELLAKIGLGSSQHNIIGQGEVDRILAASPRERRDIFEEAIGLRLYQLKKREAERKLGETGGNTAQVSLLIKEISPHLKFLKSQAEKAEKRETVHRELADCMRAYVQSETAALREAQKRLAAEAAPPKVKLERLEREIETLTRDTDDAKTGAGSADALQRKEQKLRELESKRRELERGLGRIEGRLEGVGPHRRERPRIGLSEVEAFLRPVIGELNAAGELQSPEALRERIRGAASTLERVLGELARTAGGTDSAAGAHALAAERNRIQDELKALEHELSAIRRDLAAGLQHVQRTEANLRDRFGRLREREEEANAIRITLQRASFEREKLDLRQKDLDRMIAESGFGRRELESGESHSSSLGADELRKKIEKLNMRLEEIGGIDASVLKEYQDTKARHDFLERELGDLSTAERDLRHLIAELEERIERDFQAGFSKVKGEFHDYFKIIFGGGKGMLSYVPLRRGAAESEGDGEAAEGESEYGIEIDVDLPKKRIKGLAMLSGGERALVSIALLFAITAVNPPPFLVLDETDAALDEANSSKYAAILKELSKKTQLILITHNRETMKQAGILYGVTMGEDGVSKILSLKLEEAESYGNR